MLHNSPSTTGYGAAERGQGVNGLENKTRANSADVVSVGIEPVASGSDGYKALGPEGGPEGALGAFAGGSNCIAIHAMEEGLQAQDHSGDVVGANRQPQSASSNDCRDGELPSFVVVDCSQVANVS